MKVGAVAKAIRVFGDRFWRPGLTAAGAIVTLECEPGWTPCQKEQMKAKAANMDAAAKSRGTLTTRSMAGRIRNAADTWAAKFGRDWDKDDTKGWPGFADPAGQQNQFYHPCAETDDPLGDNMQADHAVEVQCGGSVKGPFIWLDADVNGASGRQIKKARGGGFGIGDARTRKTAGRSARAGVPAKAARVRTGATSAGRPPSPRACSKRSAPRFPPATRRCSTAKCRG